MTDVSVGVFHPEPDAGGGAEKVFANVIEALDDCEVTVYYLHLDSTEGINRDHDTEIDFSNIKMVRAPTLERPLAVNILPNLLEKSINRRKLTRFYEKHDVFISTSNEIPHSKKTIEYIHYPIHYRARVDQGGAIRVVYDKICSVIANNEESSDSASFLTNSKWTKKKISQIYDITPKVIYPPVEFDASPIDFESREEGVISIGRVSKDKDTHKIIDVYDALMEINDELHIHLIGPTDDSEYSKKILEQINNRKNICYEGKVERDQLESLISNHKYGLHTKRAEHYGIAVAEMVEGGVLPVVHDSGGQREVVTDSRLRYQNSDEAANILDKMNKNLFDTNTLIENLKHSTVSKRQFKELVRKEVQKGYANSQ